MPDDFQPDDMSLPEIPDPDQIPPAEQEDYLQQVQDARTQALEAMGAEMAASDQAVELDDEADFTALQQTGADMAASDAPKPAASEAYSATSAEGNEPSFHTSPIIAGPPEAGGKFDEGAVPTDFGEFLGTFQDMQRSDQPPRNTPLGRAHRRYQQLQRDNGIEAPPGQEDIEVDMRENQQGFVQAEKDKLGATGDLFRVLGQLATEHTREITQTKDTILRNRH